MYTVKLVGIYIQEFMYLSDILLNTKAKETTELLILKFANPFLIWGKHHLVQITLEE